MKIGVAASMLGHGLDIRTVAQAVEEAGLESLFLTEHTHLPVSRRDLFEDSLMREVPHVLDQFSLLGAASVITSTLKLGTSA